MSDERVIIGGPDVPGARVYPGSRRFQCSFCPAYIWLAPTGQKMVQSGAVASCVDCAMSRFPGDTPVSVSPETLKEIELWINRN